MTFTKVLNMLYRWLDNISNNILYEPILLSIATLLFVIIIMYVFKILARREHERESLKDQYENNYRKPVQWINRRKHVVLILCKRTILTNSSQESNTRLRFDIKGELVDVCF